MARFDTQYYNASLTECIDFEDCAQCYKDPESSNILADRASCELGKATLSGDTYCEQSSGPLKTGKVWCREGPAKSFGNLELSRG